MPFIDAEYRRAYHRTKCREFVARQRAERIAAGQCIRCRTPVERFQQCIDCRTARATYYQHVVKPKLQAQSGRCADCRRKCIRPGARRCGNCTAKRANAIRWALSRRAEERA